MASKPQPSKVREGASSAEAGPADSEAPPLPTNAEDRKAAAAMSNLEGGDGGDDDRPGKEVDTEALGQAMKNLDVGDSAAGAGKQKAKEVVAKKVKIDQADVALLVDQLDMSKAKATDLLKAHEGDAVKAMSAFVMTPV